MSIVTSSLAYFGDPTQGRPLFNGYIYVGVPDDDPKIEANQKQVSLKLEDGSTIQVGQPLRTGPGGYVTYNGAYAIMLVDGDFSLVAENSNQSQVLYIPNNEALFDASSIGITINGLSRTSVQSYLQNQIADNYTELRAIPQNQLSDTDLFFVKDRQTEGDLGGGEFYWDDSNLSSEVVADEVTAGQGDGGRYVAPDFDKTGASGAFVRVVNDGIYTPNMYGATGDGDTVNNTRDDLALQALFSSAPNGSKIRNASGDSVYVVSTTQTYDGKYFDLSINLKAKIATYWAFIHFNNTATEPMPWFVIRDCCLDGNKSEQWYMPAPSIATLDENGVPYGKAYPDPTINYHNPTSQTGFSTTTEDTNAFSAYNVSGNLGIISVSNVEHFRGYNIEYKDLCRNGLVVRTITGSYLTVGSRGDGQVLMNFTEQSGEGYSNPIEASYEKPMWFPDGTASGGLGGKEIVVEQRSSHFGDCAYAFFVRTNNPKLEYPMITMRYSGTIENCSRQGVWAEVAGHIEIELDTVGEYKPLHPYRGSDGGMFISSDVRSGTISGKIVNGDINGNQAQHYVNVNCDNLYVIKTHEPSTGDSNPAINNVSSASNCYVESVGTGILASRVMGCTIASSVGSAINATDLVSDCVVGVKRYTEVSQTFAPVAGTTDFVLSTAVEPYLDPADSERYIRLTRKNSNVENGTPHDINFAEFSISGTGSSTTVMCDFESDAGDEVVIYWTEVHTTTISSASGTTFTSTLAEAWEVVSVEVDSSPYTLGDTRYGAALGATEYSMSRDSSNQIEIELGTTMTGTETVEIKVLPKAVSTAGDIQMREDCVADNNTIIGGRYQATGGKNKIRGGKIEDCIQDEAVLITASSQVDVENVTFNRLWGMPVNLDDSNDIVKFFGKQNTVIDAFMRGDTTNQGNNAVYGADNNSGIRADIIEIEGGHYEATGQYPVTQETMRVLRSNGSTNRRMISGTKRLGLSFIGGSAGSTGYDATNVDLATTPITPETASYT